MRAIIINQMLKLLPLFLLFSFSALAQNSKVIETKITADFIDVARDRELVEFSQNSTVEREDVVIKADKMLLYYFENDKKLDPKNTNKGNSIKKIEAKNNVKIFNAEFVTTGDYGIYDGKKNDFIVSKNVVVNNGTSVAKGEKFIYNLTTKKGYLLGDKNKKDKNNFKDDRVIVIIDSEIKDKKKKSK